jgi:hypothetical protein
MFCSSLLPGYTRRRKTKQTQSRDTDNIGYTRWRQTKQKQCYTYKRCFVRLCSHVFVGGRMSCLRYLCLCVNSGVQRIMCYVFVLFFLHLVYPMLLHKMKKNKTKTIQRHWQHRVHKMKTNKTKTIQRH